MFKTNADTSEVSPYELVALKTSLLQGPTELKMFFLKIEYEEELLRLTL